MADDKRISELSLASAPSGAEMAEIVQGGVNKRIALQTIADLAADQHFKGVYASEAALNVAVPSAVAGDYAFVDLGVGQDVQMYLWDTDDAAWVAGGSGGVVPDADATTKGIVERAIQSETNTGSDDTRFVTPLQVKSRDGDSSVLTDGATIDITSDKHTLTTASSRTFTISFVGENITIELTLTAASATQTFPSGSLCVSEGLASEDNTCPLAGTSGDKYIISVKKIGSAYYVVAKNFRQ